MNKILFLFSFMLLTFQTHATHSDDEQAGTPGNKTLQTSSDRREKKNEKLERFIDVHLYEGCKKKYYMQKRVYDFYEILRKNQVIKKEAQEAGLDFVEDPEHEELFYADSRSRALISSFFKLLKSKSENEAVAYLRYFRAVYRGSSDSDLMDLKAELSRGLDVEVPTHWTRQFSVNSRDGINDLLQSLEQMNILETSPGPHYATTGYHRVKINPVAVETDKDALMSPTQLNKTNPSSQSSKNDGDVTSSSDGSSKDDNPGPAGASSLPSRTKSGLSRRNNISQDEQAGTSGNKSFKPVSIEANVDQERVYNDYADSYETTKKQKVNVDFSIDDVQTSELASTLFDSLNKDVNSIDIDFKNLTTQEHLKAFQAFLFKLKEHYYHYHNIDININLITGEENDLLHNASESLEYYTAWVDGIQEKEMRKAIKKQQAHEEFWESNGPDFGMESAYYSSDSEAEGLFYNPRIDPRDDENDSVDEDSQLTD